MSKIDTRLIGTTLTTSATFRNVSNAVFAPSVVNLKYRNPDVGTTVGTVTTKTVTPDGSNKYTTSVLLNAPGIWYFRWEAVDSSSVAEEFSITVIDTLVK